MPTRIREVRERLGIGLRELARILGIDHGLLSRYETGDTRLNVQVLERIADALGVQVMELFVLPQRFTEDPVWVPVVGHIPAGRMSYAEEDVEGYMPMPPGEVGGAKHYFLRVHGDCMAPQIPEGSLVLVREQRTIGDKEIAVVLVGEEVTLKRVYILPDKTIMLKADDPTTPPIYVRERELLVLGKVQSVTRDVR